jgi:purine-binding chemotaxis protein CheW
MKRGPIDWDAVRASLARVAEPDPSTILAARARRLAERPRTAPASDVLSLATFALGDERYGIEMRFVREVGRLVQYAPVPGVPRYILGVTNLRGELVIVVDPRRLLGLAERGLTDLGRLVVLGEDRVEIGLVADAALGMIDVPAAAVLPAHDGNRYVRGVTEDAWIVLDGRALLAEDQFTVDHREGIS